MKASDLLLAACDVIEWQGWYKGLTQETRDGRFVKGGPVCMLGAVVCAATGNDTVTNGTLNSDYYQALDYLRILLERSTSTTISRYNDRVAETKDDIINVLIGAARFAYENGD